MEEKKTIKVSLGTVICIVVIIILLFALGGVVYYYNYQGKTNNAQETITTGEIKKESTSNPALEKNSNDKSSSVTKENEASDTNKYITLSVFTANKKVIDENAFLTSSGEKLTDYIIYKGDWGIDIYISKDEVEFSISHDSIESLRDFGYIKGDGEKFRYANEITGFDKNVVDVEFGCKGQTLEAVYIVFLMEDGTLEYTTIQNLVKSSSVEGKVENVSNIQRLHRCSTYGMNVVALDNENNLYDIGACIK